MAKRNYVRRITFQQGLLEDELRNIDNYLENNELGVSKEKYLEICAITKSDPDPEKIPVEFAELLTDTQVALQICELLPEKWDNVNGRYEGRDIGLVPMYLDIFRIDNRVDMLILISKINNKSIEILNKRAKRIKGNGNPGSNPKNLNRK